MDLEITSEMIFIGILAYGIHLFLLYIIIKNGVMDGQKQVIFELERQNELLFKMLSEKEVT